MTDKTLQTLDSIRHLMEGIECRLGFIEFTFCVDEYKGIPYIQIYFVAPDTDTGKMEDQWCRKWNLQYTMCDSEIIRTAYKAAEAAFIHELQETFRFMDTPIFSPHTDVYELVKMRMQDSYTDDTRVPVEANMGT